MSKLKQRGTLAAFAYNDANGKWIATVLIGAIRVHFEYARRGTLAWKFAPRLGCGRGSMGFLCLWARPFYAAFSHNERPLDRSRRLARDVAREDQMLAERTNA